jgi:hypothetical protein
MTNRSISYTLVALLAALALVLASVQLASAKEDDEIDIKGTVTAIDTELKNFEVETEDEEVFTVLPSDGFDLSTLQVGDMVEVEGTLNEDGTISAVKIEVEEPEEEEKEPVDDQDDPSEGYYCVQSDVMHPLAVRLLDRYETDYETLQGWFCDGFGWGQIMLALQTSETTDDLPGDLLNRRREGEGWGKIWQDLKLIGRPEDAGPPNDTDGDGRPDHAGPPNGEKGKGRPDFAGPPFLK